ncbi:MAG: hypothetical protein HOD11_15900 [Candidatus Marinimicrobia bacterium]|nr:hypothetical protein [Candidatus Neomarinimicrobiota bacterium]
MNIVKRIVLLLQISSVISCVGLILLACDKDPLTHASEHFPSGEIISPISETVGRLAVIVVEATDETGIDVVEIYVDDSLVIVDRIVPYEYLWDTFRGGEGNHRIKTIIRNTEGNILSDSINVDVEITNIFIPDDFSELADISIKNYLDGGDTISVSAGTYNCYNLNFTNYPELFFVGLDGAENVILDGGNQGRVLAVSESLVQGFTIQNGYATDNGGGGILLYGSTIRNCIVRDNECTWASYARGGGGIEAVYNSTIENNLIYNNHCQYVGGGIHLVENGSTSIINNIIYNNSISSGYGGGIYIHKAGATIYNNIVLSNDGGSLSSLNNNYVGPADYNLGVNFGSNFILETTSPSFINAESGNFHLSASSPCVDAGNPSQQYNDVDGSRNDMGAYGGIGGAW